MQIEKIVIFSSGFSFVILAAIIGIMIYIREKPVQQEAMFIFRGIMSLGGAGVAVLLTGFLNFEMLLKNINITAGGSLAVFVLFYLVNPPRLVEKAKKK